LKKSPQASIEEILTSQEQFCGEGKTPEDDITLLLLDY
jgi:hypothetical protein